MNHRRRFALLLAVLGVTGLAKAQPQPASGSKAAQEVMELRQALEAERRTRAAREEEKRREGLDETMRAMAELHKWPVKIFDVKHAGVDGLDSLLTSVFRAEIKADRARRILIVRAPQEIMPAIEDAIKRFDVPPQVAKNIEVTFYIVVASEQPDASAIVPSELQSVVKQLKGVFPYQGFRVLDTLILRCREGSGGEMSGVAPSAKGENIPGAPTIYQLKFASARIASDEKGRIVYINGLRLGSRIPLSTGGASFNYQDVGMVADVDVREGQKVVVGKSGIGGSDRTMFLVLSAKVAD